MGLDSYLFKRGKTAKGKIMTAMEEKERHGVVELAYWRKSYALHEKFLSYAINLIKEKQKEIKTKKQAEKLAKTLLNLNCQYIPLEKEDLQQILIWVKEMLSENDKEDGDKLDDYQTEDFNFAQRVIEKALKETDFENEEICYYSWW